MIVKHQGPTVNVGGRDFVVPPATLATIRKMQKLNSAGQDEVVAVAVETLQRNYPDLTVDEFESLCDLPTLERVMQAVAGASGLEGLAPGEAQSPLTGTGFTAT